MENAAQFSPPHTRVRITGEPVGNGYAVEVEVEVEDRGLGMGKETLAEANRRIEQCEALDLFDSGRLGLFVVSRLASRHGIRVHLRTSPYGGTTAVALLPTTLLHGGVTERSPRVAAEARRQPEEHDEREFARPRRPAAGARRTGRGPARAHGSRGLGRGDSRRGPAPPPPGVTALRPHRPPPEQKHTDELPRRVPQANLAPQLCEQRGEEPARTLRLRADDERTPELVRDRMAAYRDGWARGGGRTPGLGVAPDAEPGSDSSEGDLA